VTKTLVPSSDDTCRPAFDPWSDECELGYRRWRDHDLRLLPRECLRTLQRKIHFMHWISTHTDLTRAPDRGVG